MKKNQNPLFECKEAWEEHWQGMPEFNQKDLQPYSSIMIHFENRKDMEEFSKLVNQKIYKTTQSIWYPEAKIGVTANKRFVTDKNNK
jgi:hypothetical protein